MKVKQRKILKKKTEDESADEKRAEDTADVSSVEESTAKVNEEAEKSVGFSQAEEKKIDEEVEEDDDDRDYEAEYYQMMKETNGGDIFGDVYKAMDNLKGIGSDINIPADNTDDNKKDNE